MSEPVSGLCSRVLDRLQSGVLVLDAERRLHYLNPWLRAALPETLRDVANGEALDAAWGLGAGSRLDAAVESALRGLPAVLSTGLNPHPLPLRQPQADGSLGEPMAQAVQVQPLSAGDRALVMITVADVSAMLRREGLLREQADKLQSLSLTDELTGVANRRRLNLFLEEAVRRGQRSGQPFSLILIDIDHFKAYNDSLGHIAGDACLVGVAETLRQQVRRPGDLLARYGGEEFCIVLADDGAEAAFEIAEQLRASIESLRLPHPASTSADHLTISLGVATWTAERRLSPTGLLLKADRALFEAKQAGRNRVAGARARGE